MILEKVNRWLEGNLPNENTKRGSAYIGFYKPM